MSDPRHKFSVVSDIEYTLMVEAAMAVATKSGGAATISDEARELVLRTRRDLDEICRLGGISESVATDMIRRSPYSLQTTLQHFRDLEKLSNE